jgi:hypothetical protein
MTFRFSSLFRLQDKNGKRRLFMPKKDEATGRWEK